MRQLEHSATFHDVSQLSGQHVYHETVRGACELLPRMRVFQAHITNLRAKGTWHMGLRQVI